MASQRTTLSDTSSVLINQAARDRRLISAIVDLIACKVPHSETNGATAAPLVHTPPALYMQQWSRELLTSSVDSKDL